MCPPSWERPVISIQSVEPRRSGFTHFVEHWHNPSARFMVGRVWALTNLSITQNINKHRARPVAFWYIYGAGGYGVETMDLLRQMLNAKSEGSIQPAFLADEPTKTDLLGYDVVRFAEAVPRSLVTIAVGEPETRCLLRKKALDADLALASVISPQAFVSDLASVGAGCIIAPFCSIQAGAILAENVAVNTAAIVGHDVFIDCDSGLSSMINLGGATKVGARSYIGMGALVKEGLTIGHSTIVGMGSVVYTDVPDEVVCVGNPARVSRRNTDKKVFK